ncbi:MAG: hypothetical protein V1770_06465 [bacterium]
MIKMLSAKKIKCAFCKGTGGHPYAPLGKCASCRGKGEVLFKCPTIQCPSCKGSGKSLNSPRLACLQCKGIGVIKKSKSENGLADIIGDRLGEIVKRLGWMRKEIENKEKEIKHKLKPARPYMGKIKKETLWLKTLLLNKIKKIWTSILGKKQ